MGCDSTATLNLTINNSFVFTNNQQFCPGGSYTINGNTYTSAGTYTDVLTSVNGCDSTVITVITLSTGVSVSVTPSGPVNICDGLTSTLSSSVTNPNYTYQWSDANGVIVGATSTTYSTTVSGTYTLTITSPAGCTSTSNSVVVNVISVSTPSGLSTTNIQLDRATMNWSSVSNAHHYDVRIREQNTGSWTLISNIPSTTRTKTGLSSGTVYEWQVRSACSSDSSSVSAWSSSEVFTTLIPCVKPQNPNTTNITLSEATLNWDVVAGAWGYRIRYKENSGSSWSFDTTNTNSITITGLNANTVHRWQVKTICDAAGTNTSNWTSAQLFQTASCNSLSLSATSTSTTCNGGSDGSIDLTPTGGSGVYTYSWDNGSTSEDPTGLSSGTYTVTVTDSWGCTETLSVVVGDAAAIVSNNPQSFCSGGSYTINGNTYTSAGTYTDVLTSVNGCDSTVVTVITLSTGVSVSVTPSGPVSICDGLTSTLSSSVTNPNYTYQWSDCLLYTSPSPRDS